MNGTGRLRPLAACVLTLAGAAAVAQSDFMRVVDPIGGPWRPVRIGTLTVPEAAEARVYFHGGGEYNGHAGCSGFDGTYSLDGPHIRTRPRRDPANGIKCRDAAAPRLQSGLAAALAGASTYALSADGTLRITGRDGRDALFRRPVAAIPALDGRWLVERIGRDAIDPARRARVTFGGNAVSAVAGCNQWNARLDVQGPGFIVREGMMTLIGCGAEREAFDARLFAAVGSARRYVGLTDGKVRLEGGEPLLLRRPPSASTRLAGAYRACRSNPRGVSYNGEPTITFAATTVRDNAGCSARYRTDGPLLTIARDPVKACAAPPAPADAAIDVEVSHRGSILAILRPDAYAFDEEGVLRLRTRRGLFDLCREGQPRPFGS